MLEKVADSAFFAPKLAEPYKPYGGQFLEFCSISLSTYQTCMKLTRKSTEFCQFFCRHYPPSPVTDAQFGKIYAQSDHRFYVVYTYRCWHNGFCLGTRL